MNNNMKKPGSKKETENELNAGNDENSTKSISFIQLFRFAETKDVILIIIGIISAIAGGCSMPVMIILFGKLADAFVSQAQNDQCMDQNGDFNIALPSCQFDADNFTTDRETFYSEITKFGSGAAVIGVVNLVCSYLFVTCLNHAAESQVFRIRNLFLKAVLR